jgi:hypothetical protein
MIECHVTRFSKPKFQNVTGAKGSFLKDHGDNDRLVLKWHIHLDAVMIIK